jgi:hypothetical protein
MKRWMHGVAAVAVALFVVGSASAQDQPRRPGGGGQPGQGRPGGGQRPPGGGGMGGFGADPLNLLVNQKSVQEEIKATEDQVKQATEFQRESRGNFRDLMNLSAEERAKKMQEAQEKTQKKLAEILKPEQLKRLEQIVLQQRGGDALNDPKVQAELKLTDDQKEMVKAIREDAQKAGRDLFANAGMGGDRTELMKKFQEMRKANNEKYVKVLTDEQKSKWKEMVGAEFKGEIVQPMRRPGGGAGGANPNPNNDK